MTRTYAEASDIHLGIEPKGPIMRKPLLGRTKLIATKAITGDEVFGRPPPPDEEHVGELLKHEEADIPPPAPAARNFKKLNAESAKLGIVTAHGTAEFRKIRDYRLVSKKTPYTTGNPGFYDAEYTYGIPTPPEKHMKEVVEGYYGKKWLENEVSREQGASGLNIGGYTGSHSRSLPQHITVNTSRNTIAINKYKYSQIPFSGVTFDEVQDQKDKKQAMESFKMRRFINTDAKVDTRRAPFSGNDTTGSNKGGVGEAGPDSIPPSK